MFDEGGGTGPVHHGAEQQGAEGNPDSDSCCGLHRPRSSAGRRDPSTGSWCLIGPLIGVGRESPPPGPPRRLRIASESTSTRQSRIAAATSSGALGDHDLGGGGERHDGVGGRLDGDDQVWVELERLVGVSEPVEGDHGQAFSRWFIARRWGAARVCACAPPGRSCRPWSAYWTIVTSVCSIWSAVLITLRVGLVAALGGDHGGHLGGEVDVRHLELPADRLAEAAGVGGAHDRRARVGGLAPQRAAEAFQAVLVGELSPARGSPR